MRLLTCASGALIRIPHMLAAGEGGLTVSSLPVDRQSIWLVHFSAALAACRPLVGSRHRDFGHKECGQGHQLDAPVRLHARCRVSHSCMDLRPSAQSISATARCSLKNGDAESEQRAEHGRPLDEAVVARRSRRVIRTIDALHV